MAVALDHPWTTRCCSRFCREGLPELGSFLTPGVETEVEVEAATCLRSIPLVTFVAWRTFSRKKASECPTSASLVASSKVATWSFRCKRLTPDCCWSTAASSAESSPQECQPFASWQRGSPMNMEKGWELRSAALLSAEQEE